jgi:ubiquinone/menaquinone biosynthesis C-methylase UbiE
MLGVRERLCFEISRRLIRPPERHTEDFDAYDAWRNDELAAQWRLFSDDEIRGKDVLDFGCGFGGLTFFVRGLDPKRVVGADIAQIGIDRCNAQLAKIGGDPRVEFRKSEVDRIPADDRSFDTILAFDCLEHIMQLEPILAEWKRVLRPGGKALVWWSPFRGPYGPHMEAVVPIPWAHLIFGERAMIGTAARIYDLEAFVPRAWNLDENGNKKPNLWRTYKSFKDWNFINELTERDLLALVKRAGLEVARLEPHSFQGSAIKRAVGSALVRIAPLREYMTSFYVLELRRP